MREAFLLSLLIHGVLLFGVVLPIPATPTTPTTIQVTLATQPEPVIETAPPSPISDVLPVQPAEPQPDRVLHEPPPAEPEKTIVEAIKKTAKPKPKPQAITRAPQPEKEPDRFVLPEPVLQTAASQEETAGGVEQPMAEAAPESGARFEALPVVTVAAMLNIELDALSDYKRALDESLRAHRRYPKLARARQWEGTSELELSVSAQQQEPSIRLLSSSGYSLLDEQAVAMLRAAIEKTPLPAPLKQRSLKLKIPVQFKLEEMS